MGFLADHAGVVRGDRRLLARALRDVSAHLESTYRRQTRQERAASWRADGWSPGLVLDAVGGGPLEAVRDAIGKGLTPGASRRLRRAVLALSVIDAYDSSRRSEV